MLSLFIFVILIFNAATQLENELSITFDIKSEQKNGSLILTCNHGREWDSQNLIKYTVYEREKFTIVTKYSETINHISCQDSSKKNVFFGPVNTMKNVLTFRGQKSMGTLWECTILAHRDNAVIQPVVQYHDLKYSAAHCYMRIHVRQKVAPQTILVNNMELPAFRTDLSQKDVDFTTEYQYADGDIVNVICINFWNYETLTMEYNMADTMSVKSMTNDVSSSKMIGVKTKLHSGHNNSYIICTHTEADDYTKVMVKFVMRSNFNNNVFVKINGLTIRPYLENLTNTHYSINYKYASNQLINVTCEVERPDVNLMVIDEDFDEISGYNKTETNKKAKMRFWLDYLNSNKQLVCASDYPNGTNTEQVLIYFTAGDFPTDLCPLDMKLPSNGRVMELYNDYKLNVIFYEFKDGETLRLTCGHLGTTKNATCANHEVQFLQLDDSEICKNRSSISKSMRVTSKDHNTAVRCYYKDREPSAINKTHVLREIRVILREKVTTTTANLASSETSTYSSNNTIVYGLSGVGVVVIVITLVVLYYTILKKRLYVKSIAPIPEPRIDPASVYYENLLTVFQPINEREAAEMEDNHYEEI